MRFSKEYKKVFRQFRSKLKLEGWMRSWEIALSIGLLIAMGILVYQRIVWQALDLKEVLLVAGLITVMVLVLAYLIWFRPRRKTVAARIDGLGLQERIITMEELQKDESLIAELQRQDALEKLSTVSTKMMRLKIHPKAWRVWVVEVVLIAILITLPFFVDEEAQAMEEQNSQEMAIVDELISELRQIVEAAQINEDYKLDLTEIVDALESGLSQDDTTLSRTAKISTASKRLDAVEKARVTYKNLGILISSYDYVDAFGTALKSGDAMAVEEAIGALQTVLEEAEETKSAEEYVSQVSFVADSIDTAVMASGYEEGDLLVTALGEVTASLLGYPEDVSTVFAVAQVSVGTALTQQNNLIATIDLMQEAMGTAVDTLNHKEDETESGMGETQMEGSQMTEGEMTENPTEGEMTEKPTEEPTERPTEGEDPSEREPNESESGEPPEGEMQGGESEPVEEIYDPEEGQVEYNSVYDEYYEKILEALTQKDLPDDLRELIEKYAISLD